MVTKLPTYHKTEYYKVHYSTHFSGKKFKFLALVLPCIQKFTQNFIKCCLQLVEKLVFSALVVYIHLGKASFDKCTTHVKKITILQLVS